MSEWEEKPGSEIKASVFKATCLKLIDSVAASGEEVIITKHGKPLAKLVPFRQPPQLYGLFKGRMQFLGDVVAPIDVDWEVLEGDDGIDGK